jgi:predicted NUDIX family phosphoesterase
VPEEVLVFKRDRFPGLPAAGLIADLGLLPAILAGAEFIDRDRAEVDPTYKQIIPYCILRYGEQIFRYKRSGWAGEKRLQGLFSIGVGGHVNRGDELPLLADFASVLDWARDRELAEEFRVEYSVAPRLIALLNDDSTEVARVHFGVIYEYWLNSPRVTSREKRVHIQHAFVPIAELIQRAAEYEGWSRIIVEQYFSRGNGAPGCRALPALC